MGELVGGRWGRSGSGSGVFVIVYYYYSAAMKPLASLDITSASARRVARLAARWGARMLRASFLELKATGRVLVLFSSKSSIRKSWFLGLDHDHRVVKPVRSTSCACASWGRGALEIKSSGAKNALFGSTCPCPQLQLPH